MSDKVRFILELLLSVIIGIYLFSIGLSVLIIYPTITIYCETFVYLHKSLSKVGKDFYATGRMKEGDKIFITLDTFYICSILANVVMCIKFHYS